MTKYAWEPNEKLVPADEVSEPRTVDDLLKHLGVADQQRELQLRAVDDWLRTHRPGKWMRVSLRREGFPDASHELRPVSHAPSFSPLAEQSIITVTIVRNWSLEDWHFPRTSLALPSTSTGRPLRPHRREHALVDLEVEATTV